MGERILVLEFYINYIGSKHIEQIAKILKRPGILNNTELTTTCCNTSFIERLSAKIGKRISVIDIYSISNRKYVFYTAPYAHLIQRIMKETQRRHVECSIEYFMIK